MRQTIKTIPYELEEAAKMDGANLFQILWKVYVPLLKPAYISFGMISASFQWNNFLWPLVMTDSVEKRPLSLGLAMFAMSYETGMQWSDVSAATVLVCAPLLILFFVFRDSSWKALCTPVSNKLLFEALFPVEKSFFCGCIRKLVLSL